MWRVAGASVCGVSHVRSAQPCQDAHGWRELSDGTLVAAVADGAGTAAHGDLGANLAVRATLDAATTLLGSFRASAEAGSLLRELLAKARESLFNEAAGRNLNPRDLATTLLIIMATPDHLTAAQVGDGAVISARSDGTFHAVTRPPIEEYVNETSFLISDDAVDQCQLVSFAGPLAGLALFTDGLQRLALRLPQGEPHAPFFLPLFRHLANAPDSSRAEEQLRHFLQSPRILERADDDLTLVLAVPLAAP